MQYRMLAICMLGGMCGLAAHAQAPQSTPGKTSVERIAPSGNKTIIALGARSTLITTKPNRTLISFGDAHLAGISGTIFIGSGTEFGGNGTTAADGKTSDDLLEVTESPLTRPTVFLFEAGFGHDVIENPLSKRLRHDPGAAVFTKELTVALLDTSSDGILSSEAGGFSGQDLGQLFKVGARLTNAALQNYVIDFGKLKASDLAFIGTDTAVRVKDIRADRSTIERDAYGLGYVRVISTGDTLVLPEGVVGAGGVDPTGAKFRNIFLPDSFVFRFDNGETVLSGNAIIHELYSDFSNASTAHFTEVLSMEEGNPRGYSTAGEAWVSGPADSENVMSRDPSGPGAFRHGPAPDEYLGALNRFDPKGS